MLEFSSSSFPIATKEHACDLCRGAISSGSKYLRFAGKEGGNFFNTKYHLLCAEIIRQYCRYVGDNEYDPDSVGEWVEEMVCGECEHGDEGRDDFTPCSRLMSSCSKVEDYFMNRNGVI